MSRLTVTKSNVIYRTLFANQIVQEKFFATLAPKRWTIEFKHTGFLQDPNFRRYSSNLAGAVKEGNILYSPFGDIEEATKTLPEFVFQRCEEFADRPAITCGITGRSYSYTVLQRMIRKFGQSLLTTVKLKPGDTVGLVLPNIPEFAVAVYGSLVAGLKVTFANPLYTPDELSVQFKDSNVKCVITIDMFKEKINSVGKTVKLENGIVLLDNVQSKDGIFIMKSLLEKDYNIELPKIELDNIAIIPYSSGTTGLPKGVMLSHKNLVRNLLQILKISADFSKPLEPNHTVLTVPPFFHIYGFNAILNYNLTLGRNTLSIPKFTPEDYIDCLIKYRPKALFVVPSLLTFLGNHPSVTKDHLSSVGDLTVGAAPLTESVIDKFLRKCEKSRDNMTLRQGYGMTESSPAILLTPNNFPISKLSSAGQLVPGTEGRIVSLVTGENLGPNHTGELLCRGPQVMKGYLNNPKATEETLDEENWLHTGDVAYYDDDHFFYIVDRTKELIKVKGNQVSPTELENVVSQVAEVADVAVVGVPDHLAGELPKAFVVLKPGKSASAKRIYDWVAERVVKYKRLDGGIAFVDSIPRNSAGKIMRGQLKILGDGNALE